MKHLLTTLLLILGMVASLAQDCSIAATLPYSEDFSTGTPECWEYEDTDNMNPVWTYNDGVDITGNGTNDPVMVTIPPNISTTQKDDWVFARKIAMTANTQYSIEVAYNAFNLGPATASENFELVITDAPSSTATFSTVIGTYNDFLQQGTFPGQNDGNDIKTQAYTASETFTPTTTGDFYVAIHALGTNGTEAGGFFLFNVLVDEVAPGCTPAPVPYFEDLSAGDPPCFAIEDTDGIAPVWSYNDTVDIDGDGTNDPLYSNISPGVQFPEKDDWVFSRAVQLEAGTTYYVSSHYNAVNLGNATSIENFELWVLDAQASTAPFQELLNTYQDIFQEGEFPGNNNGNDLKSQAYLAEEGFTPTSSGTYYVGIHAIDASAQGGGLLLFDVGINTEPVVPLCNEPAMLPYSEDFSAGTPECWDYENTDIQAPEWTFNESVDIDGDGTNDPILTLIPNNVSQQEKDDWAFSKAITLSEATEYLIELDYNSLNLGNITASENFELVITDAQNSDAIVETLATYSDILQQGEFPGTNNGNDLESMAYTASETFTPSSTGEYYVAIHATGASGADAGGFLLFNLNVSINIAPSDGALILLPTTGFVSSVNYNGSSAAGYDTTTHFLWNETNGFETIGGVVPAPGIGGKTGISDDGLTIGASSLNTTSGLIELSMYDVATQTWTPLGGLGGMDGGGESTSSHAISGDASTIVGLGYTATDNTPHAVRWTETEGVVDLGSTVVGAFSRANATNLDGTVIGGWQDSASGFRQGAVWTNGEQQLVANTNGDPLGAVEAVSNDGLWAAGEGSFANNFQAYRWSETTGVENIGPPLSPGYRGLANGLNEDGSIVVGSYRPNGVPAVFGQGFIWIEGIGIQDLNEYATSLGIDTQGVTLSLPLDISADGSTVVGTGRDSNNSNVGFVLKLAPTTVLGISENTTVDEVILFPNPAKDVLNISTNEVIDSVEIYAITGQQIMQTKIATSNASLNISTLKAGVYIVNVTVRGVSKSYKLLKQ
tara:strand:- start:25267 stop:28281 length:3015 start_codon:yes stop_codon:yes gene_type:complete